MKLVLETNMLFVSAASIHSFIGLSVLYLAGFIPNVINMSSATLIGLSFSEKRPANGSFSSLFSS